MNEGEQSQTSYEFKLTYGASRVFDDLDIVLEDNFDTSRTAYTLQLLSEMSVDLYTAQSYYKYLLGKKDLQIKKARALVFKKLRGTTKGAVFNLERHNPLYDKVFSEKDVETYLYSDKKYAQLEEDKLSLQYIFNRLTNSLQQIRVVNDTIRTFHVDVRNDLKQGRL